MDKLHFQNILNKENIDTMSKNHGYRNSLPMEKFIMDFELLYHIRHVLPDCVVKGGMAVPFHLSDKTLRRLSVDIDIVTGLSREQVIEAMRQVSAKLKDLIEIEEPHVPAHRIRKKLPLLTYYCTYRSSIDDGSEIKFEIFYDNKMEIQTKKIEDKIEIMGLPIDFGLTIYDSASLIGDKLTTLPFGTIGLNPDRKQDIPKQIHDIATLLKSSSNDLSLEMILDTFEKICLDEMSYYTDDPPSFQDVLDDLDRFPNDILISDTQIKLNPSYRGRFEQFTTEMLGNNRYPHYVHVADILLVKTIIKLIQKKFKGVKLETITEKLGHILDGIDKLSKLESETKIIEVKKLVAKHGKKSTNGKIMKNLLPEQTFLYDQLVEIEKIMSP